MIGGMTGRAAFVLALCVCAFVCLPLVFPQSLPRTAMQSSQICGVGFPVGTIAGSTHDAAFRKTLIPGCRQVCFNQFNVTWQQMFGFQIPIAPGGVTDIGALWDFRFGDGCWCYYPDDYELHFSYKLPFESDCSEPVGQHYTVKTPRTGGRVGYDSRSFWWDNPCPAWESVPGEIHWLDFVFFGKHMGGRCHWPEFDQVEN